MTLLYALHTILRGDESLAAGRVYEFDAKDGKQLLAFEAARLPTEEEVALYRLVNPAEPETSDDGDTGEPAPEKPKPRGRKPAAEAPAATADTDPDVAKNDDLV